MSWISQTHFKQRIFNRKFDDPFRLELMVKDIRIAMEPASRHDVPAPLSALGRELWKAAAGHSEKSDSISQMVRWVERMTGQPLDPGSSGKALCPTCGGSLAARGGFSVAEAALIGSILSQGYWIHA